MSSQMQTANELSNLRNMGKFYLTYRDRLLEKYQMPSGKLAPKQKTQTPSGQFTKAVAIQPSTTDGRPTFSLSLSQYVFLLPIENPEEQGSNRYEF